MKPLINAGFGREIGAARLDLIESLGFAGVRQDLLDLRDVEILAAELAGRRLHVLWVLGEAVWRRPADVRAAVSKVRSIGLSASWECGNELDLVWGAAQWAPYFAAAEAAARDADPACDFWTPGTSSTSLRSLSWLRELVDSGAVSTLAGLAVHTYRSGQPFHPLDGYASRQAEWAAVREIAAGRRYACTEVGWAVAEPKRRWYWPPSWFAPSLSEDRQAQYLRAELEINRQGGAEWTVVYQISDGATDHRDDRMGVVRYDGSLRPAANVAREVR